MKEEGEVQDSSAPVERGGLAGRRLAYKTDEGIARHVLRKILVGGLGGDVREGVALRRDFESERKGMNE